MYDSLSAAMREKPTVQVNKTPRMADWYKWGCAIVKALGIPQDKFETAYLNNKKLTSEDIVLNKPFFEVLKTLLEDAIPQETKNDEHIYEWLIDDFKREMSKIAEDMGCLNDRYWPSKNNYKDQLKNNVPALQSIGITTDLDKKRKINGKTERIWEFKKRIDPEEKIITITPQNVLPFDKQQKSYCVGCEYNHGDNGCALDPTDLTPISEKRFCPKKQDVATNQSM